MLYAEVIFPLAVAGSYHYRISSDLHSVDLVGHRVLLPFGPRRMYTGVVCAVSSSLPSQVAPSRLKSIDSLLDEHPMVTAEQLALWQWIASYYHCTLGQVMRQALPSGLMPESQTRVYLSNEWQSSDSLTSDEIAILDLLSTSPDGLSYIALHEKLGKVVAKALPRLIEQGALHTEEVVRERYRPLEREYLSLGRTYQTHEGLEEAFELLRRSPAQAKMLQELIDLLSNDDVTHSVRRVTLSRGDPSRSATIRKLVDKGILEIKRMVQSRIETNKVPCHGIDELEPAAPLNASVALLYAERMHDKERSIASYIRETIARGYQVLMITPTTTDTPSARGYMTLLNEVSGGRMYSYHTSESEARRTELYIKLVRGCEACLVLGGRSAIFLPMPKLGLIVVDDEHEYMLKQQYAPPYFHARDVALYRGATCHIPVLLASATPSAETLFNVFRQKYALLHKPDASRLTSPMVINISEARRQRQIHYQELLSRPLLEAMADTLQEGKRILVLQNRRGYAPYLVCQSCGKSVQCPQCAVSLTYYAKERYVGCTYCDYREHLPVCCPSCGERECGQSHALRPMGYGVERVAEEIARYFPDVRLLQIDSESLQTAKARAELHARLQAGDVDVVVGTQLIAGQSLWDDVGLIAVVQLDAILAYTDFRAEERAFQLLHQLRLRAQDRGVEPRIVFQTLNPKHPFVQAFGSQSYSSYIKEQLVERNQFQFPPFVRLTSIRLTSADEVLLEQIGYTFVQILKRRLGNDRVSDLQKPSVARIDLRYVRQILCRRPYHEAFALERQAFSIAYNELVELEPLARRVRIVYDVDPH